MFAAESVADSILLASPRGADFVDALSDVCAFEGEAAVGSFYLR